MRHNNQQNNNNRRFRGNNGGGNGGGNRHHSNGGGHRHSSSGNGERRINPRVQTFDSNGPEVRIRGNAVQINEKYLTLARDAQAAGDRVLAESYLQHAEHYQRMLNEAAEEQARHQAQYQQQNPQVQNHQNSDGQNYTQQDSSQHGQQHQQPQQIQDGSGDQPSMNDLDQSFLVKPVFAPAEKVEVSEVVAEAEQPVVRRRTRAPAPAKEADSE